MVDDLNARGIPLIGRLADLRLRLKQLLAIEKVYCAMDDACSNKNNLNITRSAMIKVIQALPCILHLENCVGERILKMLLIDELEAREGDTIASNYEFSKKLRTL